MSHRGGVPLAGGRGEPHIARMDNEDRPPTKIENLVSEAKAYLAGVGIKTTGKSPAEILDMARAERNKPGKRVRWVPPPAQADE